MALWEEGVGWYGTAAVLGAYALLTFGVLAPSVLYQLLNATGAVAVAFISYRRRAYEPVALNLVWLAVALVALGRLLS